MFKVNEEKCFGCGTCIQLCPSGAISLSEDKAFIDQEKCQECGRCKENCPGEAIEEK